jgi:hypothetical protein
VKSSYRLNEKKLVEAGHVKDQVNYSVEKPYPAMIAAYGLFFLTRGKDFG